MRRRPVGTGVTSERDPFLCEEEGHRGVAKIIRSLMKSSCSESVLGALISLDSFESFTLGLRHSLNEVLDLIRSCTVSSIERLLIFRKRSRNCKIFPSLLFLFLGDLCQRSLFQRLINFYRENLILLNFNLRLFFMVRTAIIGVDCNILKLGLQIIVIFSILFNNLLVIICILSLKVLNLFSKAVEFVHDTICKSIYLLKEAN